MFRPPLRFAFLLYISRSGSTMLANQIARRLPNVLVLPEVDFVGTLVHLGDQRTCALTGDQLRQLLLSDPKHADLDLPMSAWDEVATNGAGHDVHSVLSELSLVYARHTRGAVPDVVMFQRGTLIASAPSILRTDRDARFLHIYRDPRGAISSIMKVANSKMGGYDGRAMGRSDPSGLGHLWRRYMERVDKLKATAPDRVLEISFEQLCVDNEATLLRVAELLNVSMSDPDACIPGLKIDPNQSMLHQNIDRAPMRERIDGWRAELPAWRGYLVEHSVGTQLLNRGYKPEFVRQFSAPQRIVLRQFGRLERLVGSVRPIFRRVLQLLKMRRAVAMSRRSL